MLRLCTVLGIFSVCFISCGQAKHTENLARKKCVPCKGGTPPMNAKEERDYLKHVPLWHKSSENPSKISREFNFSSLQEGLKLVNEVATVAEQEGHHPDIILNEHSLRFDLYTHKIGGLAESDFIMAAKIDVVAPNAGRSENIQRKKELKSGKELAESDVSQLLRGLAHWRLVNEPHPRLSRRYVFKNFDVAMRFFNELMPVISSTGQGFDVQLFYNRMSVEFYTRDISNVTVRDFEMATRSDALYQQYKRSQ